MTAGPWTFTNAGLNNLLAADYPLSSAYKVCLVTSGGNVSSSSTTYSGLTDEVSNANGYTTGGIAVTLTSTGTTTVAVYFASSPGNPIWTASGSGIAAYWAVLYNTTSGNILAYCLLNSAPATVTVSAGNTLEVQSDNTASNPLYTLVA